MSRQSLFLAIASRLRRLPPFRGKVRSLLALHRALGLLGRHVIVEADLWRPAPYKARLDLHSWLQRLAYLAGGYEEETVRFLLRLAPADSCLLDVGANVGLIALPFVASTGKQRASAQDPAVVAVEVVPSNYEALVHNFHLNGLSHAVRAICAGVGDRERSVEIQVEGNLREGEGTGTANIMAADSTYECQRNPLQITTIDRLLGEELAPRCRLVKLDTDGYDLFALMGATTLLERTRPIVFGEFSAHCMAWHHHDVSQVASFATQRDYLTLCKAPGTWRFARLKDPSTFVQDLLLIPIEREEELRWCRV